jgi:MFS family permease
MTARNLKLFNFIFPLSGAFFFAPIVVPFLSERGLSAGQMFWLATIFSTFVSIFEIPSGFVSDFFGRKKTLIVAFFLIATGLTIHGSGKIFWHFATGEFFWALGFALRSGTDSALIFETLKTEKRELDFKAGDISGVNEFAENQNSVADFKKVFGHFKFLEILSIGVSAVLGGFLAKFFGFEICFFLTAIAALFAAVLCFFLREKKHFQTQKIAPREIWEISRRIFLHEKIFRNLILFVAIGSAAAMTSFWFEPLLFLRLEIPLQFFGILLLVSKIFSAGASKSAHFFVKFCGERKFLFLNFAILISIFAAVGIFQNYFLIPILFGGGVVLNFLQIFIDEKINEKFENKNRATALSVNNFARGFLRAALTFLLGFVFDFWNFEIAAFFVAGFVAIFGGIFLVGAMRKKI